MYTTINRVAAVTLAGAALTALLFAGAPRAEASTIFACVKKHSGTVRLVSKTAKCKKHETKLSWNSQGAAGRGGASGAAGSPGSPGLNGREGPQGPGAESFTTTLPLGTDIAPVITLSNGIVVAAGCVGGEVQLMVETTGDNNLEASGTRSLNSTMLAVDAMNLSGINASDDDTADIDVIAADSAIGKFDRIDLHGSTGSPCKFWAMVTPTT
jgi:hypothetical protein